MEQDGVLVTMLSATETTIVETWKMKETAQVGKSFIVKNSLLQFIVQFSIKNNSEENSKEGFSTH